MKTALVTALAACTPALEAPVIEIHAAPPASGMSLPPSASASPQQQPQLVAAGIPFADGQTWIGRYFCAQGETTLLFHVTHVEGLEIDAIFDFHHDASGADGAYRMSGRWDPSSGSVTMTPGQWLQQPPRYIGVGMTGRVSGARFTGKIDEPSCRDFSVVLDEAG
jgi:hypothetical protein